MIALACRNVTVRRGVRPVVNAISFSAETPGLVGIVGPNGAGKSTLMRALVGLQAHDGEILWGGTPVTRMDAGDRARKIAFLPQDRAVHWALTCLDVVLLGRLPHRSPFAASSARDLRHARESMARMDVLAFAGRSFDTLSGGEQARVLIARMLAQDPRVLVADEPVNGLDPAHQIALMEHFQALAREGRAVFVSLHDLTLASRWCDRLLVLDDGRLAADGAPGETLDADLLARVYGIRAETLVLDGHPAIVPAARLPRAPGRPPEGARPTGR
ncbi:ABC transporter ATP-binding protein [Stappia sp.]|uniref:ABC transporter ATP-binding protein n=1 Tax=Stappia sp. TaxID=1870903 RepID=UPI0032D95038